MARRSGRSLTFKDAVRILDDGSPFVRDLDQLIEHAFEAVPVAGPLLGLPYFAFRRKLVEYGEKIVSGIRDRVDGVGRYDRTQRLYAAHAVIVMTAFAEALGELLDGVDLRVQRSQGTSSLAEEHGQLILWLNDAAMPDAATVAWSGERLETMTSLYSELAMQASTLLSAWGLSDAESTIGELPARALRRYEEYHRRLVAQAPEFAVWVYLAEHKASRAELGARIDALSTGLAAIPELLATMPSRAKANQARIDLARRYQAMLTRSVLGETQPLGGVELPTLAHGYVNPAVRVAAVHSEARPSEDHWWDDRQLHDDIQAPLIGALTAADAVEGPLVILGQPGAGKSVLTRMLAARLADRGFLPVRVELRNVLADADMQTQIEHAIHDTIGRSIEWPELVDSAHEDGLLPLIILDGFDELLQATGVNQSDYLEQVARFQRREFDLGRPVAAIVTSRTAVADRARFPEGRMIMRIEPFDEARVATWLGVWNEANGTSLNTASVLRYGELAEQPLLLTLLALYDAETGDLHKTGPELSRAELYDRLLTEFARREVRKPGTNLDAEQEREAVTKELHRLELVAMAMFNRHSKLVTAAQLDADLVGERPSVRDDTSLAKPLTVAQLMVGRFFFVHESSVQRAGETEHSYEFLHATLGEFLVARHVVETLRGLTRDREYFRSTGRSGQLDDGELWVALSFAALTGSSATVEFTDGLLRRLPDAERAAIRDLVTELLLGAQYRNPHRSRTDYEPREEPVFKRHGYYSANLTTLAVLSNGEPLDFHAFDMGTWQSSLRFDEFDGLRDTIRVLSTPGEDFYDMRIVREDGSPVDPYESGVRIRAYSHRLDPSSRLFVDSTVQANSEPGLLIRESAFSHGWDHALAALLPYFEFIGDGVGSRIPDGGIFVPMARGLLELRLAPFASHGTSRRCELYKWCFSASQVAYDSRWLNVAFRQLREDVRELEPSEIASLLKYAIETEALEIDPEGFADVLCDLWDVDEEQFRRVVETDKRLGEIVEQITDGTQK